MYLSLNIDYLVDHYPLDKVIDLATTAGFDAADYSLEDLTDPNNAFHKQDAHKLAESIGLQLAQGGLPVRQTHAPFHFEDYSNQAEFESFIYPTIVRSIELSAAMGAKVAVVHPLHHMLYEGHEEEIFELNMKFYKSLIPVCQNWGIKVGVENMLQRDRRRARPSHDTCSRIEEFCRYIDTLNSEYMVACLDVGHVGLAPHRDEAWDFIRILGHERLLALHIHDNDYRTDKHSVPFNGLIDWHKVTKALGEINYSGDFTYEVIFSRFAHNIDDCLVPETLRYMGAVGKHLVKLVDENRPRG